MFFEVIFSKPQPNHKTYSSDLKTKYIYIVLIDLSHNQLTGDIRLGLELQVTANTDSALCVLTLAHNKLKSLILLYIIYKAQKP